MKKEEIDELIEELDICYKKCLASDLQNLFFPNLYEYVNLLKNQPSSQKIIKLLIAEKSKSLNNFRKLEIETFKEFKSTFGKIDQFFCENKINDTSIPFFITDFKTNINYFVYLCEDFIYNLYDDIYEIVKRLYFYDEYRDFIRKLLNFGNKDIEFFESTFFPYYEKYETEKEKIKNGKETKILYYWDRLNFFHDVYLKSKKDRHGVIIPPFELRLFQELDKILNNEEIDFIRFFYVDDFEKYLKYFHVFFKKLLEEERKKLEEVPKFTYIKEIEVLKYNGRPIKNPEEDKRPGIVLSLIFSSHRKKPFKLRRDVVNREFRKSGLRDLFPHEFYNLFKRIKEDIKDETGIEDFLFPHDEYLSVDPKYIEHLK